MTIVWGCFGDAYRAAATTSVTRPQHRNSMAVSDVAHPCSDADVPLETHSNAEPDVSFVLTREQASKSTAFAKNSASARPTPRDMSCAFRSVMICLLRMIPRRFCTLSASKPCLPAVLSTNSGRRIRQKQRNRCRAGSRTTTRCNGTVSLTSPQMARGIFLHGKSGGTEL